MAVHVYIWSSAPVMSLMVKVPPETWILESPRPTTLTLFSLYQVMRGAGSPDDTQVKVATDPISNAWEEGVASTMGWAIEK